MVARRQVSGIMLLGIAVLLFLAVPIICKPKLCTCNFVPHYKEFSSLVKEIGANPLLHSCTNPPNNFCEFRITAAFVLGR